MSRFLLLLIIMKTNSGFSQGYYPTGSNTDYGNLRETAKTYENIARINEEILYKRTAIFEIELRKELNELKKAIDEWQASDLRYKLRKQWRDNIDAKVGDLENLALKVYNKLSNLASLLAEKDLDNFYIVNIPQIDQESLKIGDVLYVIDETILSSGMLVRYTGRGEYNGNPYLSFHHGWRDHPITDPDCPFQPINLPTRVKLFLPTKEFALSEEKIIKIREINLEAARWLQVKDAISKRRFDTYDEIYALSQRSLDENTLFESEKNTWNHTLEYARSIFRGLRDGCRTDFFEELEDGLIEKVNGL